MKKTEGREGKEMVKMGDGDEEGKVREWREAKGIKVRRGEEGKRKEDVRGVNKDVESLTVRWVEKSEDRRKEG